MPAGGEIWMIEFVAPKDLKNQGALDRLVKRLG